MIYCKRKASLGEASIQIYAAAVKHREMPNGQQVLSIKVLLNAAGGPKLYSCLLYTSPL